MVLHSYGRKDNKCRIRHNPLGKCTRGVINSKFITAAIHKAPQTIIRFALDAQSMILFTPSDHEEEDNILKSLDTYSVC